MTENRGIVYIVLLLMSVMTSHRNHESHDKQQEFIHALSKSTNYSLHSGTYSSSLYEEQESQNDHIWSHLHARLCSLWHDFDQIACRLNMVQIRFLDFLLRRLQIQTDLRQIYHKKYILVRFQVAHGFVKINRHVFNMEGLSLFLLRGGNEK